MFGGGNAKQDLLKHFVSPKTCWPQYCHTVFIGRVREALYLFQNELVNFSRDFGTKWLLGTSSQMPVTVLVF